MRAARSAFCLATCWLLLAFGVANAQNAVTHWSAIAERTITANRSPASSEVLLGIVHAAMYDAVVAVDGRYRTIASSPAVDAPASASVAAGAAAYSVLKGLVPAQETVLAEAYTSWLAPMPEGDQKDNGVRVGER